jgi:cytidylate kinase
LEAKSIAIDGPSGAGKSTLAKLTARKFGSIYVDTGALYRAIGLFVLRRGVASKDAERIAALLGEITLEMRYDEAREQRVLLCGEDVTDAIRTPEASIYASDVSALLPVRAFLLEMQRDMARRYDVIMDGRDIGTVVLPGAGLKVFLHASPHVRAGRRYRELVDMGVKTTPEEVLRDINARDKKDSTRDNAPLKPAEDAVMLDTSKLSLDESFERLCALIRGARGV